jgi:hypothetical protein
MNELRERLTKAEARVLELERRTEVLYELTRLIRTKMRDDDGEMQDTKADRMFRSRRER